ncbi:MAG: ABC transporter permease/substrate-binding protein [Erysipelotrichaceae bacterium]
MLEYVTQNYEYIISLFVNHLQLTILSVTLAVLIGVPFGIIISSKKSLQKPIMGIANIIQAIPSLALLGILIPYLGIAAPTAIFMVVLYSLLPILKNTSTSLSNISPDIIESAKGIGMTKRQILFKVKIPLALPIIMAGIRISSVTSVGLMTIAAYIGAGGLGTLVLSGIQTDNAAMILSGAIPACLLALAIDFITGMLEKYLTPIALRLNNDVSEAQVLKSKKRRKQIIIVTALALAMAMGAIVYSNYSKDYDITVGSKEAVEGNIMGNIIADIIEAKTDLKVERKMGLGGTMIAYTAIVEGEVDIYPEYSGTAYTAILGKTIEPGFSTDEFNQELIDGLAEQGCTVSDFFGFNNTYIIATTQEFAQQYGLEKISDLQQYNGEFKLGGSIEFAVRDDGLPGLSRTYDLSFKSTHSFSGTLMYTAIDSNEVDLITAFSTDALLTKYDLVFLEDDQNFFPPYDMFPLVNTETLEKYPEVKDALALLGGLIDDETMQYLNNQAVEFGKSPAVIAREFLIEEGLVTTEDFE